MAFNQRLLLRNSHNQKEAIVKNCMFCLVTFLLGTALAWGQEREAPRSRTEAEVGVQVLTRGPVHEAFAETVTFDPEPGILVSKAPPATIEELPPDQKPEGANVAWIPGYWGWDDERSDFLWVSGVWRMLPPGRQWVPGYWGRSTQGFRWTSGYWAKANVSEVEYLPEPPATVEVGPNITASSVDQTWLPGCWVWQQGRYAWRPGFWAAVEPDWVWFPAHYVWAPRGYVFVDGYWDYSIGRRGVLFAPVYFDAGVYRRPGFSYSPTTVIDLGVFASHLFLRPLVPTLLFRRLLRCQLPRRRVPSLVFDQHRAFCIRSDLRSPALAASTGQRMGASPTRGLREPARSRKPATTAYLGEPGGNWRGRRGFSRARHRG